MTRNHNFDIWAFAFGYFACYVPYSALTKALSSGLIPGITEPVTGLQLLPVSLVASIVGMFTFITAMGWWKFAGHRRVLGVDLPAPGRWTFLSGLCTSVIVATTTLAYTFTGVSIVFVMLLMRGGVLILAPMVDRLSGRRVRWFSWMGLMLSMGALLAAFSARGGYHITLACAIDVACYLAAYFVRLRLMSNLAKSADPDANRRYFVEEQMVATPAVLILLGLIALVLGGQAGIELRSGFVDLWTHPATPWIVLVGLLSQGTGVFGGLILLDSRENTFCVPVNRSSSVLAGVGASFLLTAWLGSRPPGSGELVGAALIIAAILFLTLPPMLEKRRAAQAGATAPLRAAGPSGTR